MYITNVSQLEMLRTQFNPIQARLIPAHVTLCREDEVADWKDLESRIQAALPIGITLNFGSAVRDGNLVYLPVVSGVEEFDSLRHRLLGQEGTTPRKQTPHITIIHPRNGICTDDAFAEISARLQSFTVTLREISLIEQTNGGPWRKLAHF